MDAIQAELTRHVGRRVRLKIGETDYIGHVDKVDDQVVQMTTGSERPCEITIRTDAIDAVMVFV